MSRGTKIACVVLFLWACFMFWAVGSHAAPCDNPPAGSCLTYTGDCEGAVSNDESYTVGALDRVDARGVNWTGPDQDPHLFDTGLEPEPEVTGGDATYPSCFYGGRMESPGLNAITTPFDGGGSGGDDGWHDLDGFQIHAPNVVVEGLHIKNRGDGIVRQKASGCGVDPFFTAKGNWIDGVFDNAFESDGLAPALIEDNLVLAYKSVFAWRPSQTCESTIDGSAGTVDIKNNLVELAPGASPFALGLAHEPTPDDGSGYIFNWPTVAQGDIGPKIALRNNVFLVTDIAADEFGGQIFPLLDKLVTTGTKKCSGNIILMAAPTIDADSWEDWLENHGQGPDGYTDVQRWSTPGNLYQTFTGAAKPCFDVVSLEDHASACLEIAGAEGWGPEAMDCFRATAFTELGTAQDPQSWDDLVAAWKASHTAANE